MYKDFVELLQQRGLKVSQIAKATGLNPTTFTDWKNGKSTPKIDKLQKIADCLKVDVNLFLDDPDPRCPICGMLIFDFHDKDEDSNQSKEHIDKHIKIDRVTKKYGFFYPYIVRERLKVLSYKTIDDKESSEQEKVQAWIDMIECYFSRSIEHNNYDLSHPDFSDYTAMFLNNSEKRIGHPLYDILVEKYGIKGGLEEGMTIYEINKTKKQEFEDDIKLALFGGDGEVTDEMWNEALFAIDLIKQRHKKKKE